MKQKTLTVAALIKRLKDPRQLKRILAPTLGDYRKTLKYPQSSVSWAERERHMATRLVEAGLSRIEVKAVFDTYYVGLNYRRQRNKRKYFDDIYSNAVANAIFAKNLKAVIVKGARH